MRRGHTSRRDMLQNIAITLLSVSAVLLFIQTQSYMLSTDDGFVGNLFQSGAPGADTSSQPAAAALSAPVRAAVSGTYGRYGEAGQVQMINSYSLLQSEPRRMPNYWLVKPAE